MAAYKISGVVFFLILGLGLSSAARSLLTYDLGGYGGDGYASGGGGGSGGGSSGGRNGGASSTSPLLDPSDVYGASGSGGGLLGGSSYGNTINWENKTPENGKRN